MPNYGSRVGFLIAGSVECRCAIPKMIFPTFEVASKIAIALGVGLLVGLEREW